MEAVADLDDRLQAVGQAEGAKTLWRDEHGQAVGLKLPEGVIVNEVEQQFLDCPDLTFVVPGKLV
jgi:hypothetical protein